MINCQINRIADRQLVYQPLEKKLYHAWLFQKYLLSNLQTTDGKKVSIIRTGRRNELEGPDFSEAQILIDDNILTGDVEIHINNADWYHHGHHKDPIYNNVILHVVLNEPGNREIITQDKRVVPTLILKPLSLNEDPAFFFCEQWIGVELRGFEEVLNQYAEIRFRRKSLAIRAALMTSEPSSYFYKMILDVLGYSQNRESFRQLAGKLPLPLLYEILESVAEPNRIITLESLFFGVAGFLDLPYSKFLASYTEYFQGLKSRWEKMQNRFGFSPASFRWHFAGSRPANYPTRRIAALVQIILSFYPHDPAQVWINQLSPNQSFDEVINRVSNYFQQPAGLWKNHPLFIKHPGKVLIGSKRLMDLIVNLLLPFTWAIGSLQKDQALMKKAIEYYRFVPKGEMPSYVKKWMGRLNVPQAAVKNNFLIQGAIELNHRFCKLNLCKLCPLEVYANR